MNLHLPERTKLAPTLNVPTFLLVDDDEQKRALIAIFLRRNFPVLTIVECTSGAEGIDAFDSQSIDAIVTDHSMVPVSGIEMIEAIRRRNMKVPIVMVTGHPSVEGSAIAAGANSVISFSRYAELPGILCKLLRDQNN